jgi:hypothetical protein
MREHNMAKKPSKKKVAPSATTTVTRSKAARGNIAEGTRLFALAGRPTKHQFILVYGIRGPRMTWTQRAAAGVPAEEFQEALAKTKV